MNNFIAVTGFADSGKTTISLELAKNLAKDGFSVLLVLYDDTLPPKEYLFKNSDDDSLGKVLTESKVSEKSIMKATSLISENLGFLGYCKGETATDYPGLTNIGVDNFLEEISKLCDYVIFDIQNKDNILFQKLEENNAKVISVMQSSIKSIAWTKRNGDFWQDIVVLNKYHKGQIAATEYIQNAIMVPFSNEVFSSFESLNAFKQIKDKKFLMAIDFIKKQIATL